MAKITFITGGQRSGKSSFAQKLAINKNNHPIYLATSRKWDKDHKKRIEKHREDRSKHNWTTIEEEKYLSKHLFNDQVVLIDCITLWLTNFYYDNNNDIEKSYNEAVAEIDKLNKMNAEFIIVTNEIGMGAHPDNLIQMKFADLQGWVNQYIAKKAEKVLLMVSGIPLTVK
jgi:adenosylcobinamide kinase/adenosylcobinamide-phosphate guanylyltransferase